MIELMAVLALIAALIAILAPSLSEAFSGSTPNRAADILLGSATQARQLAANRRTPIALVITRPDASNPDAPQAVMLMEAIPPANGDTDYQWKPAGGWTSAPGQTRIDVFERDHGATYYTAGSYANLPANLPVRYRNTVVSDYDYIVFHPNGTVQSPQPGPALAIRSIRRAQSSQCMVIISNEVGFPRAIRP